MGVHLRSIYACAGYTLLINAGAARVDRVLKTVNN
jgi:hypothetical protein